MFLGIDIGTSSVKAALIDEAGRQVEVSQAELPISRPKPLWSEQNPSDWWTATNMAVAKLDVNRRHRVKAVGLSGQMHGATLLDESLAPIRPAILWNDGRSFEECRDLQKSTPAFVSKGGNLVMPGFTAPKLEWVRRHEPGAFEKVHKVLLPKDYVRLRMTGDLASDMSDSSGTLWMDVEARTWSEELLAACGLTIDHMPKLYEGHEVTGVLRQEAAEAWGMDRVPVVAGGGDNAAGAAGVGVIDEGEALLSLGTSGVIFVAGNTFRSNPDSAAHAFCHALPDRWHLMSVMLSAASCLDWAVKLTGTSDAGELVKLAQTEAGLAGSEQFLPYLSGERTPHNNPHASGVLFGLTHDSGSAQIGQAVLEGVAFGMADGFRALVESGVDVHSISVIGGGAQSTYWGRILSAVLDRPMVYRDGAATGPAYGAARLARYASMGGSVEEMFEAPEVLQIVEPKESDRDRLAPKYEKFGTLYRILKDAF
ncbi:MULTISPECIES: xylulokinase [unclassified Hyphomonas]|uniref:xylulokinase n=1 Tax=unclassified Hyphomonas TaxID=2630699 RepID=UPI000C3B7BA1|nr:MULTISPECIES: xylulokinase [unclassified Hyphomonas]MAN91154.1 xylulokinase [Hyphomonadaceae bacterium]HAW57067.1 xylulokinase [Hyphomonas sp.]HBL93470.1 xylulokinase [Hyphomonas sp.]HBN91414.1 xylulokinase [Hyphomonas sp.]HBT36139.1 xylulokinase [Hyphomonas sp.]